MAQTPCIYRSCGDTIDHTPVGAVAAGDVIVKGATQVTIAPLAIAAGVLGAVATEGLWTVPKVTGSISDGAKLYWDADANPVGGTAGSGAFTTNSALGPFGGWNVGGAESGDATAELDLQSTESPTSVSRSSLGQDDLAVYNVPLASLQATGTGAQLGAAAGTPSGAMGLTIGAHGTNSPLVVGEAASGNSKTDYARFQFALPAEYVSGETITLRVRAKATGTINTAKTLDAQCYVSDGGGGISSDICATAAQAVTTSFANYDFTITPTSRVAGDMLDIQLVTVADDTGGTNNKLIQIGAVELLLDIKG